MIEALRSVCRDVCGPAGTSAVVRSNNGSGVTLTACGNRFLDAFAEHPVPGVVVQNTCAAQQAIYGEGGLTSTILACTLIRLTSELGPRRRTDHLLLADTFQRCLGWCYECLESTSGGTPTFFFSENNNKEAFAALARTVLFPKLLAVSDTRAMDAIADALVRSFVADGDADEEGEKKRVDRAGEIRERSAFEGFVDGLRVLEVVGAPREFSRRAAGVFIARAPVMDFDFARLRLAGNGTTKNKSKRGRVLIVADPMRLPERLGSERGRGAGKAAAVEIARACETLGVGVVLCARAVDRHLQQLLFRRNILVLERVPAADLDAVAHATGARPLATWTTETSAADDEARDFDVRDFDFDTRPSASYAREWSSRVGAYEDVLPATLEGNPPVKYVKMCGSKRALDTLLLCAPTVVEMEELAAVVESARRALSRLAAEPDHLVVGGGAVETALAAHVRARARAALGVSGDNARTSREAALESEAARAFAAALEETAGNKRRDADVDGDAGLDRSQPVESLGAKMDGIRKAVEVACAVMRIDAE